VELTVVMRNTGTATWTAGGSFRLAAADPRFGMPDVPVPGPVEPDREATFAFSVGAPATAGVYELRWRMAQDGGTPFGDLTPSRVVVVTESPECTALRGDVAELDAEIAGLQADLQGAGPGEKGSIATRIRALRARRQALVQRADGLGCARS
jgi:hypothetical protein